MCSRIEQDGIDERQLAQVADRMQGRGPRGIFLAPTAIEIIEPVALGQWAVTQAVTFGEFRRVWLRFCSRPTTRACA